MASDNTDFTMLQGDTQYIKISCFNEANVPIILANASEINFTVIPYNNNSSAKVIEKTILDIAVENVNTAIVVLEEADTVNLSGKFRFYFQLRDYSGDKFTKEGIFVIKFNGI